MTRYDQLIKEDKKFYYVISHSKESATGRLNNSHKNFIISSGRLYTKIANMTSSITINCEVSKNV